MKEALLNLEMGEFTWCWVFVLSVCSCPLLLFLLLVTVLMLLVVPVPAVKIPLYIVPVTVVKFDVAILKKRFCYHLPPSHDLRYSSPYAYYLTNLQLFPGAKNRYLIIQQGLHHHRNSISSYQDNVGWWLMVDLLPSEAILLLTWSAPKDYIVKNSLFKIIYFLHLCYFYVILCVC